MKAAIRSIFVGDLTKYAVREGVKAITKFRREEEIGVPGDTEKSFAEGWGSDEGHHRTKDPLSAEAKLIFPVGLVGALASRHASCYITTDGAGGCIVVGES